MWKRILYKNSDRLVNFNQVTDVLLVPEELVVRFVYNGVDNYFSFKFETIKECEEFYKRIYQALNIELIIDDIGL